MHACCCTQERKSDHLFCLNNCLLCFIKRAGTQLLSHSIQHHNSWYPQLEANLYKLERRLYPTRSVTVFVELTSTWARWKNSPPPCVYIIVPRGKRKMKSKLYIRAAKQINSDATYIFITCKLTLGKGIVAFIFPAAGQLVWEDLQWGNRTQELFPGHEGVWLNGSPAEMTSSLSPHLWLIGLRFHFKGETMDYWVWSSVTKRPGHLTALLYWSIWRSHHWLNHTDPVEDQCSPAQ